MKRTAAATILRQHKTWLLKEMERISAEGHDADSPVHLELIGRFNSFRREEKKLSKKK